MAAARQLGLLSEPGMFVLGRPGHAAAKGGREGRKEFFPISSFFSLQPFGLTALSCSPPLTVPRAGDLREATHSRSFNPLLFLGSLEALDFIQEFQVSVEKQLNRLDGKSVSSSKGRDPNSHLIQGNSSWCGIGGTVQLSPQPLFALPCPLEQLG